MAIIGIPIQILIYNIYISGPRFCQILLQFHWDIKMELTIKWATLPMGYPYGNVLIPLGFIRLNHKYTIAIVSLKPSKFTTIQIRGENKTNGPIFGLR